MEERYKKLLITVSLIAITGFVILLILCAHTNDGPETALSPVALQSLSDSLESADDINQAHLIILRIDRLINSDTLAPAWKSLFTETKNTFYKTGLGKKYKDKIQEIQSKKIALLLEKEEAARKAEERRKEKEKERNKSWYQKRYEMKQRLYPNNVGVTMIGYNKITRGMSRKQVANILGEWGYHYISIEDEDTYLYQGDYGLQIIITYRTFKNHQSVNSKSSIRF